MSAALVVTLLLGGLLGHLHPPRRDQRPAEYRWEARYSRSGETFEDLMRSDGVWPAPWQVPSGPETPAAWRARTARLRSRARRGLFATPEPKLKTGVLLASLVFSCAALAFYAFRKKSP